MATKIISKSANLSPKLYAKLSPSAGKFKPLSKYSEIILEDFTPTNMAKNVMKIGFWIRFFTVVRFQVYQSMNPLVSAIQLLQIPDGRSW